VEADGDRIHVCVFESPCWVERFELHPNGEPSNRAVLVPGGWVKLREQALPTQLTASRKPGAKDHRWLAVALLGGALAALAVWAFEAIFALTAAIVLAALALIVYRAQRLVPATNRDSSNARTPLPPRRTEPASVQAPPNREEAS
jgi:hypothetical protein